MKTVARTIILVGLALFTVPQLQAASIGYLVLEKGIIKHRRNLIDKIYQKTGQKVPLDNKDEVQTGKSTRITIFLQDKKEVINMYSNSFLRLSTVSREKSQLTLPIGKVRCLVKRTLNKTTRKRRRFGIKTATAVIGVKGTDFIVQTTGRSTDLLTLSGIVTMANVADLSKVVEVAGGRASRIKKDAPPTKAVEVPKAVQEKIAAQDTGETWTGVEFQDESQPKQEEKEEKPEETSPLDPQETIDDIQNDLEDIRDKVESYNTETPGHKVKFEIQ
ncbi:MAG: FecR domain-containing protein [Proteobacteria bacterium]|nr:FecR domain-containing protein [Pseudomonadota bacterium]